MVAAPPHRRLRLLDFSSFFSASSAFAKVSGACSAEAEVVLAIEFADCSAQALSINTSMMADKVLIDFIELSFLKNEVVDWLYLNEMKRYYSLICIQQM